MSNLKVKNMSRCFCPRRLSLVVKPNTIFGHIARFMGIRTVRCVLGIIAEPSRASLSGANGDADHSTILVAVTTDATTSDNDGEYH